MAAQRFDDLVSVLTDDQAPRVWSFLVTVFGDLAQGAEDQISGALIARLTEQFGIKPEAMRVALHRLRKDGWIESRRTGRRSVYELTAKGRRESAAASPRIYGTGPLARGAWLVLSDPGAPANQTVDAGAVWITASLRLTSQPPVGHDSFVAAIGPDTDLPAWMKARVVDPETVAAARRLADRLDEIQPRLGDPAALGPIRVAALRALTVHDWRRIALRLPALPDHVFPDGWAGPECRHRMADCLAALPAPDLAALEEAAAPTGAA